MLGSQNSKPNVPNEVEKSLELLDNILKEFDGQKTRSFKRRSKPRCAVPTDVRRSLQLLDNILGEYDDDAQNWRRNSQEDLRTTAHVSQEVSKSLEVLDRVLDEFEREGGRQTFSKLKNNGAERKPRNEDVRRSLEVLDSVLAEFDDCLESWDEIGQHNSYESGIGENLLPNKNSVENGIEPFSLNSKFIDGSTSHDSGVCFEEQPKVISPPPIPKRSASTKLSDCNSGIFNFSSSADNRSLESLLSDSAAQDDAGLSAGSEIRPLSNKDSDDVFAQTESALLCSKCGDKLSEFRMEAMQGESVPSSPFLEKRRMFEDNIIQYKLQASPSLSRAFHGSSFKVKQGLHRESVSEPPSLVYEPTNQQLSDPPKYFPKALKLGSPESSPYHAPNCNCRERIQQLQAKFAETRLLLKMNKIKGLEQKPPSFAPPPPPKHSPAACNGLQRLGASDSGSSTQGSERDYPLVDNHSQKTIEKQKLCKKCSVPDSKALAAKIADLPKLLPTDALNRPHLGLSYSMEDDLSPGVKEILQTPNGKISRPLSRISKATSLSTFSLSDSSLGYVSSQSDLEVNNSSLRSDKVPISTIKFSTLPEGMDLHSLPSYYGEDPNQEIANKHIYRDRNFNHTTEPQHRSSSAPPPPEAEKSKKKHFRAFSRKEKKKSDDNVSIKSYLSSEDGVILKSIDGGTENFDVVESTETGVEKKRWSGLRSILGKR